MKKWFTLIVLIALIPAIFFGYKTLNKSELPKTTTKAAAPAPATPPTSASTEPDVKLDTAEIHGLINQERAKAKLRALTVNDDLYDSAMAKCEDMKKNNYFTHKSPSGKDYTSFIKTAVPTAKLTGENLGAGYTDNAKVVSDWMQSDQHKANVLNPKFTSEAIAVCGKSTEKPGLIIVAHFIQS
jgi:uncharacterized protein YkwD